MLKTDNPEYNVVSQPVGPAATARARTKDLPYMKGPK